MHSAQWKNLNFEGKKVGIVGSGSSAVQIIPELAAQIGETGELHCYQRKPAWVTPKTQFKFPQFVKWMFANVPLLMLLLRTILFLYNELRYVAMLYPPNFVTRFGKTGKLFMIP